MEWLFELYVNVIAQKAVESAIEEGERLLLVAIRDDRIWHVDIRDMGLQIIFTEADLDREKYWNVTGRLEYLELGSGTFAVRGGASLSLVEWHIWREFRGTGPDW